MDLGLPFAAGVDFGNGRLYFAVVKESGSHELVRLEATARHRFVSRTIRVAGVTDVEEARFDLLRSHDAGSLIVIPLLGTFDGSAFVYPIIYRIDAEKGSVLSSWKIPAKRIEQSRLASIDKFKNRTFRAVYRSSSSPEGLVALVPTLPSFPGEAPRHDEVWLLSVASGNWVYLKAHENITAITFNGERLTVATADGRLWEWR